MSRFDIKAVDYRHRAHLGHVELTSEEEIALIAESSAKEVSRELFSTVRYSPGKYLERVEELSVWEYKLLKSGILRKKKLSKLTRSVFSLILDDEGEGEYLLKDDYVSSKKKVKLMHVKCGYEYSVTPVEFSKGSRCPACSSSKGEKEIQRFLDRYQIAFTKEKTFQTLRDIGALRFDFFVGCVAIEFDGIQHFEAVDFFGGEAALRDTQRRDAIKDKYCADNGIPLIRIPYWDFDNIDAILTEKLLPLLRQKKVS